MHLTNRATSLHIKVFLLVSLILFLTACGFRLRGSLGTVDALPFNSIYITIDQNTALGSTLRRIIRSSSPETTIVNSAAEPADVVLQQVAENRSSREVSLNPQGRVEEFELRLTYTFRLVTPSGEVVLADTTLEETRDLPFDDRVVQAKEAEEAALFNQMQLSLVSRIYRRISAADVVENFTKIEQPQTP